MPFQKGNKLAKGGKRPGAGPPTKEQKANKISFLEALEREREKRASKLVEKYYEMAESDPATMRHLVDRVMPPAKQEIDIVSTTYILTTNVKIDDA